MKIKKANPRDWPLIYFVPFWATFDFGTLAN
jgi:hypothetical protein